MCCRRVNFGVPLRTLRIPLILRGRSRRESPGRSTRRATVAAVIVLFAIWPPPANSADSYLEQVKPVLQERCYACHGALKQESGLRLDTGELIRAGGDSGPIVDPKQPEASVLLQRLLAADDLERMPPEGSPLTNEQIAAVTAWIRAGAKSPADEQPEPSPDEHWAFQRPRRPQVPSVSESQFVWNEIDAFLVRQWEERGIRPVADAEPAIRLRRLYLDLTGLPPSSEDVERFLQDPSRQAWEATVDRLLDSVAYGERWGRHWMDVWRYSDWYGRRQNMDVRNSAPQIWRWRDWMIDSLNADRSYARMVQEMLAADEIAPDDDTAWPATGYLVRNYYSLNPNEWMRHNVEYTGKAFLGLTFNCAHCHDHKYDPIAHEDYFRFRAFFEPLGIRQDRVVGEPEPPVFEPYTYAGSRKVVRLGMVRVYDESPDAVTQFYTGGDERNVVADHDGIRPGVPDFLNVPLPAIKPVSLPVAAWYPGARPNIQQAILSEHRDAVMTAQAEYDAACKADSTTGTWQLPPGVSQARNELAAAVEPAAAEPMAGALNGQQSLVLDATGGGRVVLHQTVDHLNSIGSGMTISFRCLILQDGHFNFQLARDASKHLTALYVGFRNGQIRVYQPGGFTEVVAARYVPPTDPQWGPGVLHVRLQLRPDTDLAELTIVDETSGQNILESYPIALNGWNGPANANQPITLDCQTGTQVVIDDVHLVGPESSILTDFEPPRFKAGQSIHGQHQWTQNTASAGPAFQNVTSTAAHIPLLRAKQKLRRAYRLWLDDATSGLLSALRLEAARQRLVATQVTVAADNSLKQRAGHRGGDRAEDSLARAAVAAQCTANIADAWVDCLAASLSEQEATKKSQSVTAAVERLVQSEVSLCVAQTEQQTAYQRFSPVSSATSTGRRKALAEWITSTKHPLTARVAVNHIWARHFRQPLVATVFDFGRNGKPPTHPQLLDWLAVHFMDHEWRMKSLHRLMVNSHAYALSSNSGGRPKAALADRDNQSLWHFPNGRMEAEVVRDALLYICGKLDRTVGGPPLHNDQAVTTYRRGLYYECFPEDGGADAFSAVFDAPDPVECFRRTQTIVPQQALALSNSSLVHLAAEALAERLSTQSGKDDMVQTVFLSVLNRPPTDLESKAIRNFLRQQRELLTEEQAVRTSLIRALFNHNDFVSIR